MIGKTAKNPPLRLLFSDKVWYDGLKGLKPRGEIMAKTKTPFLSFGSSGSVGGVLTSQKRSGVTLLRETPRPTDPYTLPQAYQRWLYEDYAYLWRQQSQATQAEYRAAGVRFHLTGFQYWMKYHLANLPDIEGIWHLDEKAGAVAYDSSKNKYHGTIFGTTPTTGRINGAQFLTLNDYIAITCPKLDFTSGDFSILLFARIDDLSTQRVLFNRGQDDVDGYKFSATAGIGLFFYTNQLAAHQTTYTGGGTIATSTLYAFGLSRKAASVILYVNGVAPPQTSAAHINPASCAREGLIGIMHDKVSYQMEGIVDHMFVYNRALDPSDFLRHSKRRYPL